MYYWQYNGCALFEDIISWCADYIPGMWTYNGWEQLYFHDGAAYTAFLLRWK
jgi:hypothetical protein